MKVRLIAPPWTNPTITPEAAEAFHLLADNVWRDSCIDFYATRSAKIASGSRAPKGMQRTINSIVEQRFFSHGWAGDAGYFFKNTTWVRVTFRHQMSLGSDFIDAIKVCKKEGMELAIILAASRSTLNIISPNDAAALVSFEKLQSELFSLEGAIDIPLMIGELIPSSPLPQSIDDELRKSRPRDVTLPR